MKNSGYRVLLIEPFKNVNTELSNILIDLDFRVISVKNVESAFKKLLEYNPDIIICQKDLSNYSGFQFYNMLNNDLLKKEIPFVLLTNEFNKDDLLVGLELGVDSFLFPPFDPVKISNIIYKQLEKSQKRMSLSTTPFHSLLEVTPLGIFEARNNNIIKANKSFYKLILNAVSAKATLLISGIFDFHHEKTNEMKFLRCVNGIIRHANFKSIPSRFDPNKKFDIFLSFIENGMTTANVIGLIIPTGDNLKQKTDQLKKQKTETNTIEETDSDFQPHIPGEEKKYFFTTREKQVLKLSAKGAPIKQIADQLGISVRTVEKHRSNIIHKTKAGNITEAVFYANQNNLLGKG